MATATELQKRLTNLRARIRDEDTQQKMTSLAVSAGGVALAGGVCWGLGFLEQRYTNAEGGPGTLGPITYPALASGLTTVGSAVATIFDAPAIGGVLSHVAAGTAGMAAGTMGRVAGVTSRAKALAASKGKKPKAVKGDDLDAADQALLDAL